METQDKDLFGKTVPAKQVNKSGLELIDIDFGIGRITVKIEPGGSVNVIEFIDAIKKAALTVPLHKLTESINKHIRY